MFRDNIYIVSKKNIPVFLTGVVNGAEQGPSLPGTGLSVAVAAESLIYTEAETCSRKTAGSSPRRRNGSRPH